MNSTVEDHSQHISRRFNAELEEIKSSMMEMGGIVEQQLQSAIVALTEADSGVGKEVISEDDEVDALEVKIDEECNLILARRQPAASDLRLVLAIIKATRDLERIGDESSKIARAGVKLSEQGELTQGMQEFKSLGERVSRMVNMALDAFARYDAESALQVAKADARVDDEYSVAMRSMITYMMEDPHSISSVLNVLWALRALERIGDHAKNISEHVIYLVQGTDVRHEDLDKIARKVLTPE
jgi:phosphate transport system protein